MSENQENQKANSAFEQAKGFIESHEHFLLASHARTDGDDCGSMLAMVQILQKLGKKALPVAKGGVPFPLQFLPKQNEVREDVPPDLDGIFDVIILFGCNMPSRTGIDAIINSKLPILNIDHHHDNKLYGTVNLVQSQKSSVAELIYDFINFLNIEVDKDIAKCLLTGIFTDTGSFMHANTKASTLEAASDLMKHGARVDKIFNFTYKGKDVNVLKAWSKALENTRIEPQNKVAISILAEDDLKEIGLLPQDAFTGFAETLNTIPNTKFSLFIRQDGDIIKGSMRSEEVKNTDVSSIARSLGGGGHKLAAGFEIKGRIKKQADGSWRIE